MSKQLRRKPMLALVALALLAGICFMLPGKTHGLGINYFDDAGSVCDISDCGSKVNLAVAETRYVKKTGVHVVAYFTNANTGTIKFNGINFCEGHLEDILETEDYNLTGKTISVGENITKVTVVDNNGTQTLNGKFRTACDNSYTISVKPKFDPDTNLYIATIDVDYNSQLSGNDGLVNTFRLVVNSGNAYMIAQQGDAGGGGRAVTMEQDRGSGDPANIDYYIRFGSDCSVTGDTPTKVSYYDMDGTTGSGGAQKNGNVHMTLYKVNSDGSKTVKQDWDPGDTPNAPGKRDFTAKPGEKYLWVIKNVYHNNTIQFSTPYDGVYYAKDCPPPANPSCAIGAQADIEDGQSISPRATASWSGSARDPAPNYSFSLQVNGVTVANSGAIGAVAPEANQVSYTGPAYTPPGPGSYTITGTFSWPGNSRVCTAQVFLVVARPYVSIYGTNVEAGGAYQSVNAACTGGGLASSWYNDGAPGAGSGGLLSVIAQGHVTGFASGQHGVNPSPASLTFANTTAASGTTPSRLYGGTFKGTQCFYEPTAPLSATNDVPGTINAGTLTSGAHKYASAITLSAATIPTGRNVSLYVNGNVTITGPIVYNTAGWTTDNIPSLTVIATGNIYIDSGIGQLDGVYIAKPNGVSGGTIYDCATGAAPVAQNALYTNCNTQLVVHGSFVANKVNLMRTYGSLRNASNAESPRGGAHTCRAGVSAAVCAGEVFDFSPELYLSNPYDTTSPAIQLPSGGATQWDAGVTLPPVL